jgi:hypothetical protein
MSDSGLHDQIEDLELQIETLAQAAERCRKISVAAKLAVGIGGAWLAAILVGLIWPNATALLGSMASMIAGVVVLGSNSTTWQEIIDKQEAAEALRRELIGRIELRVVSSPTLSVVP